MFSWSRLIAYTSLYVISCITYGKYMIRIHGLTHLFEVQSWKFILSQPYLGWIKMKTYSQTNFSSPQDNLFLTENKLIVWNCSFSGLTGIYLFKFSNTNSKIKCKICSKLTIEAPGIALISLLLSVNRFD